MASVGKLYLHFDIEADGNSPANSNMLGLGLVVTDGDGDEVGDFEVNILPRDEVKHVTNPETGTVKIVPLYVPGPQLAPGGFWTLEENQPAWEYLQKDRVSATAAMALLDAFLNRLRLGYKGYKLVWVARPAAFDWQWLKAYWELYAPAGAVNIGFGATCLSAMRDMRKAQRKLGKDEARADWDRWTAGVPLTHKAVDDARHQAAAFHGLCTDEGIEL